MTRYLLAILAFIIGSAITLTVWYLGVRHQPTNAGFAPAQGEPQIEGVNRISQKIMESRGPFDLLLSCEGSDCAYALSERVQDEQRILIPDISEIFASEPENIRRLDISLFYADEKKRIAYVYFVLGESEACPRAGYSIELNTMRTTRLRQAVPCWSDDKTPDGRYFFTLGDEGRTIFLSDVTMDDRVAFSRAQEGEAFAARMSALDGSLVPDIVFRDNKVCIGVYERQDRYVYSDADYPLLRMECKDIDAQLAP